MGDVDLGPAGQPYQRSAVVYDAIYRTQVDERTAMAEFVHRQIQEHAASGGRRLLDAACGTGWYFPLWLRHYVVQGIDLSADMLEVARARAPEVPLHQGDMATFDLGQTFDAVVCLGSSIGYAKTAEVLDRTIANFARHTAPNGVVIVHGWVTPDNWRSPGLSAELVDEPGLKIARLTRSNRLDDVSVMDMYHLVVTPDQDDHYVERHEMGLFAPARYRLAFERAGLVVVAHDPDAGRGRGIYVGARRPSA